MDLKDAEKLFKDDSADISEILVVEVPIIKSAEYDVNFLESGDLETLESGIRAAKKVGDYAWYAISVSLAKIIDGGLYRQAGLVQAEYRKKIKERLGLDLRRVSDFLQAGRFLIQNGQKLLDLGWRPDNMQHKIMLASRGQKVIKNKDKLLDAIINKSAQEFYEFVKVARPKKIKTNIKFEKNVLRAGNTEILKVCENIPNEFLKDIKVFVEAFVEARSSGGCVAAFAVETDRQSKNAKRVFYDFINGKLKK